MKDSIVRSSPVQPPARLLLAWPLAVLTAVVVNAVVAALALASSLVPRAFDPLTTLPRVPVLTAIGVSFGVGALAIVRRLAAGSRRTFRLGLAGLGLVLPLTLFPLAPGTLPVLATAGVAIGLGLLAAAPRLQDRPDVAFRVLVLALLLCSYVPDLALIVGPLAPAYQARWQPNAAAVATLMLLHTLAAGIMVACLTSRPWAPGPRRP